MSENILIIIFSSIEETKQFFLETSENNFFFHLIAKVVNVRSYWPLFNENVLFDTV